MTPFTKEGLEETVSSKSQLIDYLNRGARPREDWGVGAEMERVAVDRDTGEVVPFTVVEDILRAIADDPDSFWQPIVENDHIVGLLGGRSSITLEPGGQVELSGELCRDLHCSDRDNRRCNDLLNREGAKRGVIFLGYGAQPFTPLEEINWIPKARYGIMGPYMLKTGDMGQRMMKQTAGLQVNLDFSDETDCFQKMRTAEALVPVLYGLFANSPIIDGVKTDYLSMRGEIWSRTDPDRAGLIPGLQHEGFGFAEYVEYALDVPLYFLQRDEQLIDCTQKRVTFRDLMSGALPYTPTLADWDLHLSTIFTEVRLRPHVEVRSADCSPPHMTMAFAALVKGLLYCPELSRQAHELMFKEGVDAWHDAYANSWKTGLKTMLGKYSLQEITCELIALAKVGLDKWAVLVDRPSEALYLNPIQHMAIQGETVADQLVAGWPQGRDEQLAYLIKKCGFHSPV